MRSSCLEFWEADARATELFEVAMMSAATQEQNEAFTGFEPHE
jgi:hypothetical protein